MRILVVGSGGREHALCWKLASSPLCEALYCAPGNAGIAEEATCVPVAASDLDGIVDLARKERIDFVVVGPEDPLCLGLVDRLETAGIPAFGPSKAAAELEGSKGFMKDLARRAGIPTAAYERFTDAEAARAYIRKQGAPIVIKADGLTAGKGVVVAAIVEEALAAVDEIMGRRRFGAAGAEVVVEEFLDGEEASLFALCDGKTALLLGVAQDHKRAFDGDKGANTGGMGAYAPAPILDDTMARRAMRDFVDPTLKAMAEAGRPFKGILFVGLMVGKEGPKLLEYNVRFGDPECQVLMMRLRSDLLPALIAAREGELDQVDLRWHAEPAITVVMAARGYPEAPEKGSEIRNLGAAGKEPGVVVFHAGTRAEGGRILANGGRVLGVSAVGRDLKEARERAYRAVDLIDWPEGFCRRDIAARALGR
ncbi:MAG: phosphoribosylamine--glycine ligase [Alphaproteobacteria bacterium]|nr:phosphoribosylamine--glycine ligase [Alphaproteobacteria bacterium]